MTRWEPRPGWVGPKDRPWIMGILNATPDSFSDGGQFATLESGVRHALALVAAGADLLDIGGESSRPGSRPISVAEELARVIPLIEAIRSQVDLPLSVDTTKSAVARAALAAGADVINDISGLADPDLVDAVAARRAGVVIMHMQGTPQTMQDAPTYGDVVEEVFTYLKERIEVALAAGLTRTRIAVDPGIGFGKSFEHNCQLLRNLGRFQALECSVLVGTSRKGLLGTMTGRPVADRQVASVVSALACAAAGASIVRVHDVAATRDAFRVWEAHHGWSRRG